MRSNQLVESVESCTIAPVAQLRDRRGKKCCRSGTRGRGLARVARRRSGRRWSARNPLLAERLELRASLRHSSRGLAEQCLDLHDLLADRVELTSRSRLERGAATVERPKRVGDPFDARRQRRDLRTTRGVRAHARRIAGVDLRPRGANLILQQTDIALGGKTATKKD